MASHFDRTFEVKCTLAPSLNNPGMHAIKGSFSFGAFNAATSFVGQHLTGYVMIHSSGFNIGVNLRKFEAINYDAQLGAAIYVTEV